MAYLKPDDDRLVFVPLGGCGEIGMNLNLYCTHGQWIMVDCGMSFAGDESPGVDLIFPDSSFIEDEGDALLAMVITHGHEDHIGAIPYLWPYLKCPIYATPFTAGLIRDKLEEEGLENDVPLHVVTPRDQIDLGPFSVRYQPLAHSIAEGHGLVIDTPKGAIFHTGDWKLDDRPLIGPISPADALTALGEKGTLALVGDSTNIFNPSESGSENAVRDSLLALIKGMTGRVVLTTFASNVARLETAGYIARKTGREIALVGRSMQRIYRVARESGYLADFPPPIEERDVGFLPRDKVMILCTGCQGEPRAALSRIARGDHRELSLATGDHVIFSSKIIPGNEKTLGALFNTLVERGFEVITEKDHFIHVSGHPGQSELRQMLAWTKPRAVIPVHGEARHLHAHAAFAKSEGIAHTVIPKNGDVIEISADGSLTRIDRVAVGRLALDGREIVDCEAPSIVERRRLLYNGTVSVAVIMSAKDRLAGTPDIRFLGLPRADVQTLEQTLSGIVADHLDVQPRRIREDDEKLEDAVRIAIRRFTRAELGKNPQVMVHIIRA